MKRYVQNKSYDVTKFDDEYVVLNTDNYTVTKLNTVGGFCWSLMHEEQTVASILKAIHEEFPEDDQPDEEEIEEFIMDLVQCELVHHVS